MLLRTERTRCAQDGLAITTSGKNSTLCSAACYLRAAFAAFASSGLAFRRETPLLEMLAECKVVTFDFYPVFGLGFNFQKGLAANFGLYCHISTLALSTCFLADACVEVFENCSTCLICQKD